MSKNSVEFLQIPGWCRSPTRLKPAWEVPFPGTRQKRQPVLYMFVKGAIHSQLTRALLLFDVMNEGKNWVNCSVLTGNSARLRSVHSSRLSHRELRSSLRESHSFLSLPVFIHHGHTHKKTHRTDKPDGKPVLCQKTFSPVFRAVFFTQLNCTV